MAQDGVGVNMVWHPAVAVRVTQVFAEVPVTSPTPPAARVTQLFAEILVR